jgi:hypothetical protein
MNQTTAHGPALARRSHGVSVPGAPMRATLSMRALSPTVARSGQHVSHSPGSVLAGRTPIRGERFSPADRHGRLVACDRLSNYAALSARHFGSRVEASHGSQMTGLFYA